MERLESDALRSRVAPRAKTTPLSRDAKPPLASTLWADIARNRTTTPCAAGTHWNRCRFLYRSRDGGLSAARPNRCDTGRDNRLSAARGPWNARCHSPQVGQRSRVGGTPWAGSRANIGAGRYRDCRGADTQVRGTADGGAWAGADANPSARILLSRATVLFWVVWQHRAAFWEQVNRKT